MSGRGGWSRWAALSLMAALCLAFAMVVFLPGAGRAAPQPAEEAEQERTLRGADDPTRTALELLPGEVLDLNTATAEELQKLPGIGPALSQAIVDYREEHGPFHSVEDLLQVPGIGPGRLDNIRDLVRVEP